jgi:hypothetical protein
MRAKRYEKGNENAISSPCRKYHTSTLETNSVNDMLESGRGETAHLYEGKK